MSKKYDQYEDRKTRRNDDDDEYEIRDLTKDDLRGHRNNKKRKRDYDRKDMDLDRWN